MSVHLTIEPSVEPAAFEWLPCSVKTSGPCKRDQFFLIEEDSSTESKVPISYLRGRKLKGSQAELPEGYALLHMKRGDAKVQGESLQMEWKSVGSATSCRVWEHDIVPCESTGRMRAMEWLRVAPSMHAPISVDAVEAKMKQIAGSPNPVSPADTQAQ